MYDNVGDLTHFTDVCNVAELRELCQVTRAGTYFKAQRLVQQVYKEQFWPFRPNASDL